MKNIKTSLLTLAFLSISSLAALSMEEKNNINSQESKNIVTKKVVIQYAQEKYNLPININQSRVFGNRQNNISIASSGLPFCPPDNAIKLAVKLSFDLDEKCGKWHIVYHGTSCKGAFEIAKNGFDPNKTRQGKAYGPGIYVTPSWNIATQWTCDDVKTNDGQVFGTVLQCRVRPGSFKAYPLTWKNPPVPIEIDSNTCELVVQKPEDIVVYGILFKKDPHKIN